MTYHRWHLDERVHSVGWLLACTVSTEKTQRQFLVREDQWRGY
jgi:hypothetical protein